MDESKKTYVFRKSSRTLCFPLTKALESFQAALQEIPAEYRASAELSVSLRSDPDAAHPELSIYYYPPPTEPKRAVEAMKDAASFAKLSSPEFRSRWLESNEPPLRLIDHISGLVALAVLLLAVFVPALVGRGGLKEHIWETVAALAFVAGVVVVSRRSNWSLGLLFFACVFFFVSCSDTVHLGLD